MAGCGCSLADSSLEAEIKAIKMAINHSRTEDMIQDIIYTDCLYALQQIREGVANPEVNLSRDEAVNREENMQIDILNIKQFLEDQPQVEMKFCPRDVNFLADALAKHAKSNPGLSLFHRGADRPRWIEDLLLMNGLHFEP